MSTINFEISHPVEMHVDQCAQIVLPPMLLESQWAAEMRLALKAAWKAGAECLIPLRNQVIEQNKHGEQQSTEADYASNASIFNTLKRAFPNDAYISQEGIPFGAVCFSELKPQRSWVVDPLDGSSAYSTSDSDAYGIHIALVDHQTGEPLLGVNYYPARQTTYFAIKGCGAFKQVGNREAEKITVKAHSKEINAYSSTQTPDIHAIYENLGTVHFSKCLSCGLRICSQIDTPNNLYITSGANTRCGNESGPIRFTATWDIASGMVILQEAGGIVAYINSEPIDLLAPDGRLSQTVVVTSDLDLFNQIQSIYFSLEK